MSILASLLNTTTMLGGPVATTGTLCLEKDKKKITFNKEKSEDSAKKVGIAALASTVSTSLQHCNEFRTTRLAEAYVDSLSEDQIYEFEQLLAAKENEFTISGVTYDLSQVTPNESIETSVNIKDAKVLEKNL